MSARSDEDDRAFVVLHTVKARTPLVPEISLRLAHESTEMWRATEAWLETRGVPPPYWAFAWAGGQALARFVLDHPELVRNRTVADFGCGGGIVAIAAKLAGAKRVVAADCDRVALAATALNAEDNAFSIETLLARDVDDVLRATRADVLLAGDVFYDRTEGPIVSERIRAARLRGIQAYVGCPGRVATPHDAIEIAAYDVSGVLELEGREMRQTRVLTFPSERAAG